MDISDIKQLKADLRADIAQLLIDFEAKTDVKVVDLEVSRTRLDYPNPDLVQVIVKIDLG